MSPYRTKVGTVEITHDLVVWRQPPEIGLGSDIYYAALDRHSMMYVGNTPREAVERLIERLKPLSVAHINWSQVDEIAR